jgi:competence CoiA-like predicted nuclease
LEALSIHIPEQIYPFWYINEKQALKEQINFKLLPSTELLEYISFKDEFLEEAKQAFIEFCFRFEKDIISKSEIYCNKFNYSEVVALEIAHCTFARVWKYPTFKPEKIKIERYKQRYFTVDVSYNLYPNCQIW